MNTVQQLVTHADTALAPIEGKLTDIAQRMIDVQTELTAIADARAERIHRLHDAHTEAEQLEAAHNQAVGYAKLAHDTPRERQSIQAASTAKKNMQSAHKEVERLERELEAAESVAQAREQELIALLPQLQDEQSTLQSNLRQVQSARGQAHAELGKEQMASLVDGYHAIHAKVDAISAQLVEAKIGLYDYREEALAQLQEWPALRREFALIEPPEDATSRMIVSTLVYMDAVLTDGQHLRYDVALPWEMRDVLHVREGDLTWPAQLTERKRRLMHVQDAYLAVLTGEAE